MNRKVETYVECLNKLCALVEADCDLSNDEYKTLSTLFCIAETMILKHYPKIEE